MGSSDQSGWQGDETATSLQPLQHQEVKLGVPLTLLEVKPDCQLFIFWALSQSSGIAEIDRRTAVEDFCNQQFFFKTLQNVGPRKNGRHLKVIFSGKKVITVVAKFSEPVSSESNVLKSGCWWGAPNGRERKEKESVGEREKSALERIGLD